MEKEKEETAPAKSVGGISDQAIVAAMFAASSVFLGPFGALPALYFASKAREDCRADPTLGGRRLALAATCFAWTAILAFLALVALTYYNLLKPSRLLDRFQDLGF